MNLPLLILLCPIIALAPSRAGAPLITLDEIPAKVRGQNRDLAAARLRIAEARGRLEQSGRLTNPELEFDYSGNTKTPENTISLSLTQRFPLTARLRFEKAASRAQLAAAEAEVRDVERKLVAQAQTAAVKLLGLREQRALRERQLTVNRELSTFLLKRVETGEASNIDAVQVDLEARQLEAEKLQLGAEETALLGELRPLLGLGTGEMIAVGGRLTLPDDLPGPSAAVDARPDLQAAQHNVEAARAQAAQQRASRLEDVGVGVTFDRERTEDIPVGIESDKMVGVKVSVPLPLWNQNSGRIHEAEAAAERAQREADALAFNAAAEAGSTSREMVVLGKLVKEYDTRLLPKATELEERLRLLYSTGQSPLTDVLRARDRRLLLERQRLDALREFHLARVRHAAATGVQTR
jgi:cobalt-zinc-cadmium efflux system outer membrane protein